MQRHIDRIRDSRDGSHVRSWIWLMGKLKTMLIEMREDQNEDSIRSALQIKAEQKKTLKGHLAQAEDRKGSTATAAAAAAAATPKPKAKAKLSPKGNSKGDGSEGQESKPKADSKGKGQGDAKAKAAAKPKAEAKPNPSVPCLFWPNGTCNRGDSSPFFHDLKHKAATAKTAAAPNPKGGSGASGSSTAKATVAIAVTASMPGASASIPDACPECTWKASVNDVATSHTNMSLIGRSLQAAFRPIKAMFTFFATIGSLIMPKAVDERLHLYGASSSLSLIPRLPVVVQRSNASACVASTENSGTVSLEWIADSGASRSLASVKSLKPQGFTDAMIRQLVTSASPLKFETGNRTTVSNEELYLHGHKFGTQVHIEC